MKCDMTRLSLLSISTCAAKFWAAAFVKVGRQCRLTVLNYVLNTPMVSAPGAAIWWTLSNFAFNFNLRRYLKEADTATTISAAVAAAATAAGVAAVTVVALAAAAAAAAAAAGSMTGTIAGVAAAGAGEASVAGPSFQFIQFPVVSS
jgi:hypothetical protein